MATPVVESPVQVIKALNASSTRDATAPPDSAWSVVLDYHQRTKHRMNGYAAGPETLDWDAQPDPFRRYAGAQLESLPLVADRFPTPWSELFTPGSIKAQAFSREALGVLFELSFALAAWKQIGPDRWAVRCNPSSGNLHPTEAYVLTRGVSGLDDGLYHYAAREHGLEQRCAYASTSADPAGLPARIVVGLSSIHWREAWKYGERAFRYCQLDAGHALGALRYAAAVLGWKLRVLPASSAAMSQALGLNREADFGTAEREDPDLLIELLRGGPSDDDAQMLDGDTPEPGVNVLDLIAWAAAGVWHGVANRLDRHPMYRWPVIDAVARATLPTGQADNPSDPTCPAECPRRESSCGSAELAALSLTPPRSPIPSLLWAKPAVNVIRSRRSAQRFDRREHQSAESFFRMAAAMLAEAGLPWDAWPHAPRVHPILFAHRVEGLKPGAYALPRTQQALVGLQVALSPDLLWQHVPQAPDDLPLYLLAENPSLAGTLRTLCCHQALGSDATFAVAFVAEFDQVVQEAPWRYRQLYQEAGLLGHVLYLQAEAEGLRGTGIGCFFDDSLHELLGLRDSRFQSLYHFTVGVPVIDTRIASEPPYAHLHPAHLNPAQ